MQYELIVKVSKTEGDKSDENLAGDGKDTKKKNQASENGKINKALTAVALNAARSLVVSKVGEFTRDNVLQRKIDAVMDMADTAIMFAINPVLGAANLAVKVVAAGIQWNTAVSQQESRGSVMLQRAGYINRSRD